jgi:hypothetical protein
VSDWSRDAALRFAAQQKAKQIQDANVIRDQNALTTNTEKIWADLCELFIARCTEFNAEPGIEGILGCDTKRKQELKITRSDNAAMYEEHSTQSGTPFTSWDQISARNNQK